MSEGAPKFEHESNWSTFDPIAFIDSIAAVSRRDGEMPDPLQALGRECYAFSEQEDAAFARAEVVARDMLKDLNEGTDYEITKDPIGNMFITLFAHPYNEPKAKCVMVGSHVDSVKNGGKYDGVAGVAVGMGILHMLSAQVDKPKRNFTLAIFRSEESSPYNGIGCLGSSIATGLITEKKLETIMYDRSQGITLKEHICNRYGEGRWSSIIAQIKKPDISTETTEAYLEAHIEQSVVIAYNQKDMGVVTEGIGGARRDIINKALVPEVISVKDNSHKKLTLSLKGMSGHTGGLPPNSKKHFQEGIVWYRTDALVASSPIVNKLLNRHRDMRMVGSRPIELTGFTSVPSHQIVELLVPTPEIPAVEKDLQELCVEAEGRYRVQLEQTYQDVTDSDIEVISLEDTRKLIIVPQIVSEVSTEEFLRQQTETGTTRATVVDFVLTPNALKYNLDLREVNQEHFEKLLESLARRTQKVLGGDFSETISAKIHSPIDPEIASRLEEKAKSLGVSLVLVPSVPGHDADRVSAAGVPTGMVFLRQDDGVSHNPTEMLTRADFIKPFAVMKGTVMDMIYNR